MSEIIIEQVNDRGMIDLRGDPAEPGFREAVTAVLGLDLPLHPRSSAISGDTAALWLSIDQWLIVVPHAGAEEMAARLQAAVAPFHALAAARIIFRSRGLGSRELVMKGASVDLTHADDRAGTVRRFNFAELAAMVHVVNDGPETLDLYVFRSVGHYVRGFLETAARPEA